MLFFAHRDRAFAASFIPRYVFLVRSLDPVDLKALFDEQGSLEQTAEQVAAAEADMGTRLADDDGEISAVDKLLGKD